MKGAPEVISELCEPESLPPDFAEVLRVYTQKGLRVLACAYRLLEDQERTHIDQLSRGAMERDLHMLGLLVLQNKLKSDTTESIVTINNAKIRSSMVTGNV